MLLRRAARTLFMALSSSSKGLDLVVENAKSELMTVTRFPGAASVVESNDNFVLDCDGVIWSSDGLLPGALETIAELKKQGKRLAFVTNNSARSRSQMREKFLGLGVDVELEEMVPSGYVAARWLRGKVSSALVVGSDGLRAELEAVGIEAVDASQMKYDDKRLERIGAVVVGATDAFDYSQLAVATLYLGSSCLFVATNMDAYDVVGDDKRRLPGNGCLVESISVATGRRPDVVCGKPSKDLADFLAMDPTRTCVVGDRIDTDCELAAVMGATPLLVLTGVASAEDALRSSITKLRVTSHLGALLDDTGRLGALLEEAVEVAPELLLLDRMHAAASRADLADYLDCFLDAMVFIGTDATERWDSKKIFAAYVEQRFAVSGWDYTVTDRRIRHAAPGVAFFDEQLDNSMLGPCRSSGLLLKEAGSWRVAQYVLSMAVPNEAALQVAKITKDTRI